MNSLFADAASVGKNSAFLALLAAVYNKPMQHVNELWHAAPTDSEAALSLVQAALVSGRPMSEIGFLFQQMTSWNSEGPAQAILMGCVEQAEMRGEGHSILPIFYSYTVGKTQRSCAPHLFIPQSINSHVGFPVTLHR